MADTRIIYGTNAVTARIRKHATSVAQLYVDSQRGDALVRGLIKQAEGKNVRIAMVDSKRLDDMAGVTNHQGVAARVDAARKAANLDELLNFLAEPALLLVLDGVRDALALGTCLRNAEAFGVHAVIAQQDRAAELDAVAEHAANGAAESVPYITVPDLVQTLRGLQKRDIWVVGVDGGAENDLHNFYHSDALALILGADNEGLRAETKEVCDQLVSIPMQGGMEILPTPTSAAICLYEARSQRVSGVDHTQGFSVTG